MGQLAELQQECRKVYVDPSLMQYAVKLVSATRRPERYDLADIAKYLTFGASPRATIGLIEGARALAFMRGRSYALPEDMTGLVGDVLRHRLVLSYEALAEGLDADADRPARHEARSRCPTSRWRPRSEPAMAEAEDGAGRRPAPTTRNAEALLKRLEWTVLRRLDGLLQGDYRTLMRGAGLDLADLREYQHHDDVRHIDWNVTARLQQPYVRQFTEDRELSAWFLVDLSASVDFGSNRFTKRTRRARLRRRAGAPADAPRQPRRRPALRHRGRHRPAGARRPPSTCCELLQRMAARPAEAAAGATDLRDLLLAAPAHDQAPLDASSSSPTSSARRAGRRRSASWRSATR